jgi:serine/threonine protein kinase
MAPELFLSRPYNKSVDVYSFGMVMWEMFNQEIPFYMVEISDIRQRVIDGDRPRLNTYSLPSGVGKMIQACWSQSADERPAFPDLIDELVDLNERVQESKFVDKVKSSGDALDGLLHK